MDSHPRQRRLHHLPHPHRTHPRARVPLPRARRQLRRSRYRRSQRRALVRLRQPVGAQAETHAHTRAQAQPAAAPTGLTATAGNGSVTLSWNDPSDSSITRYEYNLNHNDTSTGNLSGWGPWTVIPGAGASTTSHTFTGLTNGKEYRYHLRAVNGGGSGAAAPNAAPWFVKAVPGNPAPFAPTGLSVTPGDGYLDISWNAVERGYRLRRARQGGRRFRLANRCQQDHCHVPPLRHRQDHRLRRRARANGNATGPWAELSRLPDHTG